MILTVTLNAALDVTYRVGRLTPGRTHRVTAVDERAGGKGVNVARVLSAYGEPVLATGLAGGQTGRRLLTLLAADGVPAAFAPIAGESRRTVAVVAAADPGAGGGSGGDRGSGDSGSDGSGGGNDGAGSRDDDGDEVTGFWEPGPPVTPEEWQAFLRHYRALLAGAEVVTLSGSLPAGLPDDAYATLIRLAKDAGAVTVLDADGEPLRHGVPAGPDVVKPNAGELSRLHSALLGRRVLVGSLDEARLAAEAVRELGAGAVVASLAAAGLVAVTGAGAWHAAPPGPVGGNPTGAGDACVAALARGLARKQPWPELLREAVALSAAAVRAPVAGEVSLADYQRFRAAVTITEEF